MIVGLVIGWVLSLLTFLCGLGLGIYLRKVEDKVEKKIEQMRNKSKSLPPLSGGVKPYTPEEKREMENPAHNRMKELI